MQVSKVFIVHKHKSICNINDMFSCHFLGLVELVDFEHPTCRGKSIFMLGLLPFQGVVYLLNQYHRALPWAKSKLCPFRAQADKTIFR